MRFPGRAVLLLALLLLLLVGGLAATGVIPSGDRETSPEARPPLPPPATGSGLSPAPLAPPQPGPAEKTPGVPPVMDSPARPPAAAPSEADIPAWLRELPPEIRGAFLGLGAERPAVDPSPYGLPPRRPGSRIGPGPGGSGPSPTGHWTKYPPGPPPDGGARLVVTVVDSEGVSVPGADVLLLPPESLHSDGVSFGDARRVGATGAGGTLEADRLPEGAAAVAVNLHSLLNGPAGLDARTSVPVALSRARTATARVALPLALSSLGSVEGRVVDAAGKALRAQVTSAYFRALSDADGRFAARHLRAGTQRIGASASGYRPGSAEVEVVGGATAKVEIRLELGETGSLFARGTVRGPEGETLRGATVYLIVGSGTLRTVQTDDAGAFAMDALPDRLANTACRFQASSFPGYGSRLADFADGLPRAPVDLVLPARAAPVTVTVLDAESGLPVPRCLCRAVPTEAGGKGETALVWSAADARYSGHVVPGRYEVVVEELDHESQRLPVEVSAAPLALTVRLVRTGEPSVDVALTVVLTSAASGRPVEQARVEVLDRTAAAGGTPVSRLDAARSDGVYRLPAPSGERVLRVTAPGFEVHEAPLSLPRTDPETRVAVVLRLL